MQCSFPRANAGLRILAISKDPSLEPVPIIVCISSINNIILECSSISFIKFFILSSNSPLNFVPDNKEDKSRDNKVNISIPSGTCFSMILLLIPSAIAVLPTPGSPIKIGLFFVLLDKICIALLISASLPIMGSTLFFFDKSVRSKVYFSIDSKLFFSL